MRRVTIALAAGLVAGLAGSTSESGAVVSPPSEKATAVLAVTGGNATPRLAWLDPATLRPLRRRSVELPYGASSPVYSPTGNQLALGGGGPDGVRIIDLRRMRITARIARRPSDRSLNPVAWPELRRLLVLDLPRQAEASQARLLVLDPTSRRVLSTVTLRNSVERWMLWARAGKRLLALASRGAGLPRLLMYGPGGGVLRSTDLSIPAGSFPGTAPDEQVRFAQPALTVDPQRKRAAIVGDGTIAIVDLHTFDIEYSSLTHPRPFLRRALDWLEPEAQAKVLHGYSRQATWVGGDLVAATGRTVDGTTSTRMGLQILDVGAGTARTIEARATGHAFSDGVLLAYGAEHDAQGSSVSGMGISAFTPDGTRVWHALGEEPVFVVETAGGYAYAPTPEEAFPQRVHVLDLATGQLLRTVRGELPFFVTRD
jgi:hypothetical protein